MAVKNLHLEHLEDEIINNGIDGGRASINFLQSLRDMMKNASRVNMTVKDAPKGQNIQSVLCRKEITIH